MAGNSVGGGGGRRSGSGSSETKGTGINPHIGQLLTDKTGQRNDRCPLLLMHSVQHNNYPERTAVLKERLMACIER